MSSVLETVLHPCYLTVKKKESRWYLSFAESLIRQERLASRVGKVSWNGKRPSTRKSTKRLNCRDGSVRELVAIRIKLNRRLHPSLLLIQNTWFMRWSVL